MSRTPVHALTYGFAVALLIAGAVLAPIEAVWLTLNGHVVFGCVALVAGFVAFWTLRWVWSKNAGGASPSPVVPAAPPATTREEA